jgi:invasion protein IalB
MKLRARYHAGHLFVDRRWHGLKDCTGDRARHCAASNASKLVRKSVRRRFAAAHYEGLNLMTYCTAAPRPASRIAAAVAATPAAFAKKFTFKMFKKFICKTFTFALFAVLTAAIAFGSPAFAQQPDAAAPAAPKSAKKAKPKPAPEAQQTPAPAPAPAPAQQQPAQAQPGQGGDQGQQAQNGQQQVQLTIFSPWTKFCLKGQPGQPTDPNAKEACFTSKDARAESGQPVANAVLIEPQGAGKKLLRVTVPLGMELAAGTRVIVDQNEPMTAPYVTCVTSGCMADYEANVDLISKMKKGQGLVIQAINTSGQPINLVMPLADFAKAYDGPPTDPKVFDEQKKLQEELQRRADEARKKLESQQGPPTSSATPPPANEKTQ